MTTPSVPESLTTAVRQGHRFLLTSHVNPDGDAVGSEVGLSRVLRKLGKGATIWNRDPTPRIYQALPGSQGIHVGEAPPKGFPDLFDAAVVLECPSPDRTGLADALAEIKVINIDHHLGNEHYGAINWVETSAPAVGELVFRLARNLNVELDRATANALYLTLVTDTGGFRFSNTSPEAFEAAAELVRSGASPEEVAGWLYESQPEAVLRLLGELLATLELHDEGRVATVRITHEMMERAGAVAGDSEGLIDYPRSIRGVSAVALFRELPSGEVKVSLRSRGAVNVEKIARAHHGGGHHNAAGFTSPAGRDPEELATPTAAALSEAIVEARRGAEEDGTEAGEGS
jgi:phosphoesterase RecJ-like protein